MPGDERRVREVHCCHRPAQATALEGSAFLASRTAYCCAFVVRCCRLLWMAQCGDWQALSFAERSGMGTRCARRPGGKTLSLGRCSARVAFELRPALAECS